ncbi:MAG: peroxiredoxin [Candidatus Marinimicrobia bacterium]|nr:peroxiredoxin [Candidatus Neomarinimicrobiota bacterium]
MKQMFLIINMLIVGMLSAEEDTMIGKTAPDFTLLDEQGVSHHLADYIGQDVVVYFYPKDDTPGCTTEACGIRDNYSVYQERKIVVFGVSWDSSTSHLKFKQKHDLPFSLLSDLDRSVSRNYGSAGLFFPKRKTFLIDKKGVVFRIYQSVAVNTHALDIRKDFDEYYAGSKP